MSLDGASLLDALLAAAVDARASEIHVNVAAGGELVRLRVDGRLEAWGSVSQQAAAAVVAEARRRAGGTGSPWSGGLPHARRRVEAFGMPTASGPRLVLQLRPLRPRPMALEALPVAPEDLSSVRAALAAMTGLVVVTGPTGSGVTETLYALAASLLSAGRAVATVEDVVAYDLPGASQVQAAPRDGLQAALRQDVDAVMIGEVRDREVARAALQRGPLVLAGLRGPDAPSAIRTLLELVESPALVAAALSGVIAQRLVRRLCRCAGAGCERCGGRGYRGQVGVLDWLPVDEALRAQIRAGAIAAPCRLRGRAAALVAAGLTSPGEVALMWPRAGGHAPG